VRTVETVVLLVALATLVAAFARRLRVPAPSLLVVATVSPGPGQLEPALPRAGPPLGPASLPPSSRSSTRSRRRQEAGCTVRSAPDQNVGSTCCDDLMAKRHRRGRQGSRRSLTPIPIADSLGDPQKISNRYTEEVRWEILLLEPVNDWFAALVKNAPAVADR
jgi:hypothetical protein